MLKSNYSGKILEAGTDEAGRGCLCGPVVAAAVILPTDFTHPFLNDSKQLTEKQRKILKPIIEQKAIAFGVSFVDEKEVDKMNVLQASITGMKRSIERLEIQPEFIIVDGNKFKPYKKVKHECIIKGDNKFLSIAAASIIAKNYRDNLMIQLSKKHNQYFWNTNFGYPTKAHREAIIKFGITKYHRKSFKLL